MSEQSYLDLLRKCLEKGEQRQDRTADGHRLKLNRDVQVPGMTEHVELTIKLNPTQWKQFFEHVCAYNKWVTREE